MELDTSLIVGTIKRFLLGCVVSAVVDVEDVVEVVAAEGSGAVIPVASLYVREALVGLLEDWVAAEVKRPI